MKQEFFIRIGVDFTVTTIAAERKPDLQFYYDQIGADNIEIVRQWKKTHQVLIVDGCGLLRENPQVNILASYLTGRELVGNVLMCKEGLRDGEPDIIGYNIKEVTAARLAIRTIFDQSPLFERGTTDIQ